MYLQSELPCCVCCDSSCFGCFGKVSSQNKEGTVLLCTEETPSRTLTLTSVRDVRGGSRGLRSLRSSPPAGRALGDPTCCPASPSHKSPGGAVFSSPPLVVACSLPGLTQLVDKPGFGPSSSCYILTELRSRSTSQEKEKAVP